MTKKKIFAGIGALAVAIIGVGIVVTQVLSWQTHKTSYSAVTWLNTAGHWFFVPLRKAMQNIGVNEPIAATLLSRTLLATK